MYQGFLRVVQAKANISIIIVYTPSNPITLHL